MINSFGKVAGYKINIPKFSCLPIHQKQTD
jgi:hypothetical protein